MFFILSMLAADVAPAPPPRPVITAPAPGPMIDQIIASRAAIPAADFDVEVRAGETLLWSGPMRVSGRSGASFSRQKSDAPASECVTDAPIAYGPSTRDSLSVSLMAARGVGDAVTYRLSVSWSRPGGGDCSGEGSSRSVSLTQSVDATRRDVTVSGDGGLTVRLHRR